MKANYGLIFSLSLAGTAMAQSHSDKEFLAKASQGNVAEVEIAKLALKKSTNQDVRAFAARMIKDHQKLGKTMAPLMADAGVKPSISLDTEHQHLYNKLDGLSGDDFDKQYVEAMDKDHHQDLKDFRDEVGSTQVPALKTAVSSGEKVIAEHTQMIDALAQKMGVAAS